MSLSGAFGVALAGAALWRARALQRELEDLRQQLARVQTAVEQAHFDAIGGAAPAAQSPAADLVPAVIVDEAAPKPLLSPAAEESFVRAASSVDAPPPPAARPSLAIDWERWIGGRGAAVLGGAALAMAGLLLFRYSIEHGLIPSWLRVTLGFLAGTACLVVSEWVLRQRYPVTANPIAGGGTVILYASAWALHGLYGLVGPQVSFLLMALVTLTCCVLSWRYDAIVIAILGLLGGFLTPLLLSTGADRPFGLFGYLLLLDVGLLYLAQLRNWPILAVLCLVGTGVYEASWFVSHLDAGRMWVGLAVTALFGVVFGLAGRGSRVSGEEGGRLWLVMRAGGVLLPFAFALYFGGRASLSPHLYPIAALLCLLTTGAVALAREPRHEWLGQAAAAASLGVIAVWLTTHSLSSALAWEVVLVSLVIGTVLQVEYEWIQRATGARSWPAPVLLVLTGLLLQTVFVAIVGRDVGVWPWTFGWSALALLLWRHAACSERHWLRLVAAAALGLGLGLLPLVQSVDPAAAIYLGVLVLLGVGAQVLALRQRDEAARLAAEAAAALLATSLAGSLALPVMAPAVASSLYLLAAGLLGLLAALAAARASSGGWLMAAVMATALAHGGWTLWAVEARAADLALPLVLQLATVAVMTALPFVFVDAFRHRRLAWVAAALAAPAWFASLRNLFETAYGVEFIAVLPLALAAHSLVAAQQTRRVWPTEPALRERDLTWFAAMAACFVAVAIPLQLQREWITLGWALEGLALLLLWRRIDSPGLKYLALVLLAGATVRLVPTDALLGYYERPRFHLVNWLLYTYLVPAASLLGAAFILGRDEVSRVRPWEQRIYMALEPIGAIGSGIAGVSVVFVWINLCIAEWFSSGSTLQVDFARMPARDLATSIAWAGYALLLLAGGVAAGQRGLRWLSLGLMMVTIVKVFLYDLGELEDLYRVASLLGLALSLIVVSLAYQRFVLRERDSEEA